jgi:hypothetical protein
MPDRLWEEMTRVLPMLLTAALAGQDFSGIVLEEHSRITSEERGSRSK